MHGTGIKMTFFRYLLRSTSARNIVREAKLLQANPLCNNSHWKDIELCEVTKHSTSVCGSSGIKDTYRFVYHSGKQNSSVSISTRLRAGRSGVSIPVTTSPDRLWDPPNSLFNL